MDKLEKRKTDLENTKKHFDYLINQERSMKYAEK